MQCAANWEFTLKLFWWSVKLYFLRNEKWKTDNDAVCNIPMTYVQRLSFLRKVHTSEMFLQYKSLIRCNDMEVKNKNDWRFAFSTIWLWFFFKTEFASLCVYIWVIICNYNQKVACVCIELWSNFGKAYDGFYGHQTQRVAI